MRKKATGRVGGSGKGRRTGSSDSVGQSVILVPSFLARGKTVGYSYASRRVIFLASDPFFFCSSPVFCVLLPSRVSISCILSSFPVFCLSFSVSFMLFQFLFSFPSCPVFSYLFICLSFFFFPLFLFSLLIVWRE